MNKLLLRTISGLIYVGIIITCILLGYDAVCVLSVILAILGFYEFSKINGLYTQNSLLTKALDFVGVISLTLIPVRFPIFIFIWLLTIELRLICELYTKDNKPIEHLSKSIFGQIYLGIPFMCLLILCAWIDSTKLILAIFLFIWLSDTGAFIFGSLFGKHKLFERISPKKTWEGFCGGLAVNIIVAAAIAIYFTDFFGLTFISNNILGWIGLGVLVTISATYGDLVESLMKRSANVKDSGNIIPGHGGILDRIDSLLLAAPIATIYIILINLL